VPASDPTPADIPVRLAARAVDVAVVGALAVALGRVIGFGFDWLLVGAALIWLYFAGLTAALGATLGKLAFGLRVVDENGRSPSPAQSLKREGFTVAGAGPFVGPIVAAGLWIWVLVVIRHSPLRQGPHDAFAGGTRVVRRSR